MQAVFLAPGRIDRRPRHDAHYDPLWREIERLDVPLAFHGGGQTHLRPDLPLEVFDRRMPWHTFSQPLGITSAAASLCAGGVLERFPTLRVALLEASQARIVGENGSRLDEIPLRWLATRRDDEPERAGAR